MLQLSPAESFPIVRVLQDHTDVDTRYVQATIRDAVSDQLLATVNLTDQGNRRFSKTYKIPWADAYGKGKFLLITTTVYDDSGYTTKSVNYAEVGETYLVQQRWDPQFTAGGGASIDEPLLRKIFGSMLPEKEAAPDLEAFRQSILEGVRKIVGDIEKPEPMDMSYANQCMDAILLRVTNIGKELKKQPQFEKTDMTPLAHAIDVLRGSLKETDDLKNILASQNKSSSEILAAIAELKKAVEKFTTAFQSATLKVEMGGGAPSLKDKFLESLKRKNGL